MPKYTFVNHKHVPECVEERCGVKVYVCGFTETPEYGSFYDFVEEAVHMRTYVGYPLAKLISNDADRERVSAAAKLLRDLFDDADRERVSAAAKLLRDLFDELHDDCLITTH